MVELGKKLHLVAIFGTKFENVYLLDFGTEAHLVIESGTDNLLQLEFFWKSQNKLVLFAMVF